MIVARSSTSPRLIDYKRMKEISDSVGAVLMADMAHISGMVAPGVIPSPFDFADVVTTTTHKTLRGPRGAMIFCKKEFYEKIGSSVHEKFNDSVAMSSLATLSIALKEAQSPEFKDYQHKVLRTVHTWLRKWSKGAVEFIQEALQTICFWLNCLRT